MVKHSLSAGNSGDEQRKIMHRLLGRRWCVASFLAGVIWTFSLSLLVSDPGTSYASVPLCFIELNPEYLCRVFMGMELGSGYRCTPSQIRNRRYCRPNGVMGIEFHKIARAHQSDIRTCIKQTKVNVRTG